ncbi:hypothetical protein EB796_008515 [Bugula neritina]|uniref:Uncharacterized protein n=1 Tax=Bugula neritina TaxID=10212 RepID=A0A7J7K6G3_BUGNE|nr:hypothetical protein EB796_008515 [Bugula neritina]
MATGSIPQFSGKIEHYMQRLESYFLIHKTDADLKKHVLIMGLSEKYKTLTDLVSPEMPQDVSYDNLVLQLKRHYGTVTNKMVERAKFREVKRSPNESVTDFVARLRAQARSCEFGNVLHDNLLEQFRIGVQSKTIRERITAMAAEQQSKLQAVIDVALQVEVDEKMDSVKLNSAPETVSAVRNGRVNSGARPKHTESNSKSQAICYRCSRTGHLALVTVVQLRIKLARTVAREDICQVEVL